MRTVGKPAAAVCFRRAPTMSFPTCLFANPNFSSIELAFNWLFFKKKIEPLMPDGVFFLCLNKKEMKFLK